VKKKAKTEPTKYRQYQEEYFLMCLQGKDTNILNLYAPVKSIIEGHLANLIGSFHSYFPDMEEKSAQLDWVRNPFLLSKANRRKLLVSHQETLLDVSSDRSLQMKFGTSTLTQFWLCEEGAP